MISAMTSAMTSGVVSCSKMFFTKWLRRRSGVQVRNQFALETRDLILENEFAFLEALELQLIGLEVEREPGDDLIQIAVRYAQLPQLFHVLEKLAIYIVLIFDFAH